MTLGSSRQPNDTRGVTSGMMSARRVSIMRTNVASPCSGCHAGKSGWSGSYRVGTTRASIRPACTGQRLARTNQTESED